MGGGQTAMHQKGFVFVRSGGLSQGLNEHPSIMSSGTQVPSPLYSTILRVWLLSLYSQDGCCSSIHPICIPGRNKEKDKGMRDKQSKLTSFRKCQ